MIIKKETTEYLPRRRVFLKLGGMALASTFVGGFAMPLKVRAAGKANPRRNARYVLFIELPGAISPPDSWDFKETKETPKDFFPEKVFSEFYVSKTLFPNYDKWMTRASLVRSMRANELVHFPGQYHTQTGRNLNVAVAKEIPAFGSIIASELEKERRESDVLPTYVSFNLSRGRVGGVGSGFLPAQFSGLDLDTTSVFSSFASDEVDEKGGSALDKRWQSRGRMEEVSPFNDAIGETVSEYKSFYEYARRILNDSRWKKIFKVTEEEKKRYTNDFGISCLLARNVLAADAGARFIYINDCGAGGNGPWDHHTSIFDRRKNVNLYTTCNSIDRGIANLVQDLSTMPGKESGKTLLDETMIVVTSEFGRTPAMNAAQGRDHYGACYTTIYLGAGVKQGRIIGKTDDTCTKTVDAGWKYKQRPAMDNTVATIYSALGIDWTKSIKNTPSGRDYDYVQTAPIGGSEFNAVDEIAELFV